MAAPSQHFHWLLHLMKDLDVFRAIVLGVALGACLWAGIAYLVYLS